MPQPKQPTQDLQHPLAPLYEGVQAGALTRHEVARIIRAFDDENYEAVLGLTLHWPPLWALCTGRLLFRHFRHDPQTITHLVLWLRWCEIFEEPILKNPDASLEPALRKLLGE